jgi:hypothetical protein
VRRPSPLLVGVLLMPFAAGAARGDAAPSVLAATPPPEVVATIDSSNQAGWWSPLAEFNGRTYYAYNTSGTLPTTHRVHVAMRSASGETGDTCLKMNGICVEYPDDIGHRQPSIGLDGDGYIHVFASMHSNTWRYFRSDVPESVASFTSRVLEMPDRTWTHTYPNLTATPDGDLWLITRSKSTPDTRGAGGRLYHYDLTAKRWTRAATFAYRSGLWVYPDDIQADPAGNLHILFEWAQKRDATFRHSGNYLRYQPSTGRFFNAAGQVLATPVTFGSATHYRSGGHGRVGEPEVQTAKLALAPNGQLNVVYRYGSDTGIRFVVYRARWVGNRWVRDTVYAGKYDTFPAVDVTHDGTTVRVYYVKRNTRGGDVAFVAEKGQQGGFVERSLAPGKTRIERLSVLMRPDGTDVVYLSAPCALGSTSGELYLQTVLR